LGTEIISHLYLFCCPVSWDHYRASGLIAALRLVFCAIGLQVMACFYNHSFLPLAIMIGLEGLLAWCLGKRIYNHAFLQKI